MTNLRNLLLTAAALAILPGAALNASSLSVTFDPTSLYAYPGETITVTGTVTNLEAVAVDLNSPDLNLTGDFTSDFGSIFFDPILGAPLTLAASGNSGDSAHFAFFTFIMNDPYTGTYGVQPPGSTFSIFGGLEVGGVYDPSSANNLVEAPFQVTVFSPEPGTIALFGLAIPALLALKRRTV
jgi:hypothetical protein